MSMKRMDMYPPAFCLVVDRASRTLARGTPVTAFECKLPHFLLGNSWRVVLSDETWQSLLLRYMIHRSKHSSGENRRLTGSRQIFRLSELLYANPQKLKSKLISGAMFL